MQAHNVLFAERGEVIRGMIPESFIRQLPSGEEVASFRFPQIVEVLEAAGAGKFDVEQFDIGVVRIDPEAAARRVIETTVAPAASTAIAPALASTREQLAMFGAAGVPLPATSEGQAA